MLDGITADSLRVHDEGGTLRAWPWPGVTLLERGVAAQRSSGHATRTGLLVGLLAGVIVGGISVVGNEHNESLNPGAAIIVSGFVFGFAGALIGGAVGGSTTTERWEAIPPETWRAAGAQADSTRTP